MSKKPDYSSSNVPALKKFCEDNNLQFSWKNKAQGHLVISSDAVELYIWVQRMSIQVRKQRGNILSKPYMFNADNKFNKKQLEVLAVQEIKKKKVKNPVFRGGVVITKIAEGTPIPVRNQLLKQARELARKHSSPVCY